MSQTNIPQISLKTYIGMLKRFSQGSADINSFSESDKRVARELLREKLLSNDIQYLHSDSAAYKSSPTAITPKGIFALESWSKYIKENSPSGILFKHLIQLIWLLTGTFIGFALSKLA